MSIVFGPTYVHVQNLDPLENVIYSISLFGVVLSTLLRR